MGTEDYSPKIALKIIDIPVGNGINLLLSNAENKLSDNGLSELDFLPEGWKGCRSAIPESPINYNPDAHMLGMHGLSLYEIEQYFWMLQCSDKTGGDLEGIEVTSSLEEPGKASWSVILDRNNLRVGKFRVLNYLGTAWIKVTGLEESIKFNIVTKKIGFADEYRSMTEGIAEFCQQLLLEWGSPTSLNFAVDPEKRPQILLEQFLFLRSVLGQEKLDFYLEIMQRNPHNTLVKEEYWHPLGYSSGSEFLLNPIRNGRDWAGDKFNGLIDIHGPVPLEIQDARKYESLDTPPNRFIKFALKSFREICEEVILHFGPINTGGTAFVEACHMRDVLDAFLSSQFFKDVGPLELIALENPTLQRREGYRQILQAWLLAEAAAQLDWAGREDAYDGTNRNVAALYEYWVYFIIYQLLRDDLKMKIMDMKTLEERGSNLFFIVRDPKGLKINLKQGSQSVSVFSWTEGDSSPLRVHFYYNRFFCPRMDTESAFPAGSYSRVFRPDYTLVIFPEIYAQPGKSFMENERKAELEGHIAYLHFDAKFRVEQLEQIFGKEYCTTDESGELPHEVADELEEEHREAATQNTYKRGDLYKMHTYNDAIRRTVGSYILYPGRDASKGRFSRYHELLPGVGAFILRPDLSEHKMKAFGSEELREFIRNVLLIQQSRYSQLFRINFWTHDTVKGKPPDYIELSKFPFMDRYPPRDTRVILGYIHEKNSPKFRENKIIYINAVEKTGKVSDFDDPSHVNGDYFLGYNDHKKTLPWVGKVSNCKLMTCAELKKILHEDALLEPEASLYFVFRLDEIRDVPSKDIKLLISERKSNLVSVTWEKLAEMP